MPPGRLPSSPGQWKADRFAVSFGPTQEPIEVGEPFAAH